MRELDGRVAIVTGGNGGIGLGMAAGWPRPARASSSPARDAAKSERRGDRAAKLGGKATRDRGRRRGRASCRALVADTVKRCGRLDILVNNAGINIRKPAHELALAEWQQVHRHQPDQRLPVLAAPPIRAMKEAGGGKIINIGSMLSIFGASFAPAYGASKGGIVQLTKSLATAWAKDNIQVNAVLPGWIDTALTRSARARGRRPATSGCSRARRPKRWGTPDDFAGIAVFLGAPAPTSSPAPRFRSTAAIRRWCDVRRCQPTRRRA